MHLVRREHFPNTLSQNSFVRGTAKYMAFMYRLRIKIVKPKPTMMVAVLSLTPKALFMIGFFSIRCPYFSHMSLN